VGSCKCGDEPLGSGATELVIFLHMPPANLLLLEALQLTVLLFLAYK
jgi:hypothetical protein